jgi:SWI/SNF-related matrix-associated actin-dependent regulator of chromatin subfamily A3
MMELFKRNMGGQMVGHLKREVAKQLATLIDSNLVLVEGVMNGGNLNGGDVYTLPM